MAAKITKRAVDELKAGGRIADSEIRGFLVRRLDSGAASYAYRYRVKGTNLQRLISLGMHGVITADQARNLAKKRAGEVADGGDPKGEREETRAEAKREQLAEENSVETILDKFEARITGGLRAHELGRAVAAAIIDENRAPRAAGVGGEERREPRKQLGQHGLLVEHGGDDGDGGQ